MPIERLRDKHILLDTCILINGATYGEPFVAPFFDKLKTYNVKPIISDAIIFEFLRGSKIRQHLEDKTKYLKLLLGGDISKLTKLPINNETFETARKISNVCANKDSKYTKQLSLPDLIIAAQMQKYNNSSEQLFFATNDNGDFPLFIFDRLFIEAIDVGQQIFNIGVYSFNKSAYNKLATPFDLSTFAN